MPSAAPRDGCGLPFALLSTTASCQRRLCMTSEMSQKSFKHEELAAALMGKNTAKESTDLHFPLGYATKNPGIKHHWF